MVTTALLAAAALALGIYVLVQERALNKTIRTLPAAHPSLFQLSEFSMLDPELQQMIIDNVDAVTNAVMTSVSQQWASMSDADKAKVRFSMEAGSKKAVDAINAYAAKAQSSKPWNSVFDMLA